LHRYRRGRAFARDDRGAAHQGRRRRHRPGGPRPPGRDGDDGPGAALSRHPRALIILPAARRAGCRRRGDGAVPRSPRAGRNPRHALDRPRPGLSGRDRRRRHQGGGAARRIGDPGRLLRLVRSGDRAGAHRRAARAADRRPGRGTGADRSLAGHPPVRGAVRLGVDQASRVPGRGIPGGFTRSAAIADDRVVTTLARRT
jgi:hypothetical protein